MTLAQAEINKTLAQTALNNLLGTPNSSLTDINNARGRLIRCMKQVCKLTTDLTDKEVRKAELQTELKTHKNSLNQVIKDSKIEATNKSLSTEFVSKLRKFGTSANQLGYSQNFGEVLKNSVNLAGNTISTVGTVTKTAAIFSLSVSKWIFRCASYILGYSIAIPFMTLNTILNSAKFDSFYLKEYGSGLRRVTDNITNGLANEIRRI